jgi:hypothetical protein
MRIGALRALRAERADWRIARRSAHCAPSAPSAPKLYSGRKSPSKGLVEYSFGEGVVQAAL